MKINRVKNSKRNMLFGVINRICLTLFPFINRTILIHVLGVKYLGLNGLFASILNILSLSELGFGSAVVYSMYKPIAANDINQICTLLNFYKKVYKIVGCIILLLGCISIIFVDRLVAGEVPENINIRIVFGIELTNVVISYFFFAYRSSLLSAYQREDIISKISTISMCIQYGLQFIMVLITKNYYVYIIIVPFCTIINNVLKFISTNRLYSEIQPVGRLDLKSKNSIVNKVKALFLHKIGGVVANSLDNIVISTYLGLASIAVYNNYWYIYSSICYFIAIFHNSILAGLGNSIVMETPEANYVKFNRLHFVNIWIVGWCSCCLMCLYQPFMKLWVGEDYMYPIQIVILLVVYFYINMARRTVVTFKEASGLWIDDRYKPILSGVVNIVLNIILINIMGIAGVIISTILSFIIIEIPWETHVLFHKYFQIQYFKYYLLQIGYLAFFAVIIFITYYVCELVQANDLVEFMIRGIICIIIPNLIVIVIFHKNIPMILQYLKRK